MRRSVLFVLVRGSFSHAWPLQWFLSIVGYYSEAIKKKVNDLIANNMVSFFGSDCHNMHHVQLYEECQTKKAWHDLNASGRLLNSTL